ncbi:hypothetical protein F52700_4562 [Fusarium sp. NRRL 52700]|nr:hypothetical protein F52700_4562 [Fusarium sp. NRRL 52700]
MKRQTCDHDNSPGDDKENSKKRPKKEQDQIERNPSYSPSVLYGPPTSPLQGYDFLKHENGNVVETDPPIPQKPYNFRHLLPPSPPISCASSPDSEDVSDTHSNLDSRHQSPITNSTEYEEECPSTRPRSSIAKRLLHSPLSKSSDAFSEPPSCSTSTEEPKNPPLLEPKLPSDMETHTTVSSEIKSNATDASEKQHLEDDNTHLPNREERTRCWVESPNTPDMAYHESLETPPSYQKEEGCPATEITWQGNSSGHINYGPILPEVGTQKTSEGQETYASTEICEFGLSRKTIASLPECIRAMIIAFCTEPKDLLSLIRSSPVFLQPFCQNRRDIVSQITRAMRFRFGGDMPHSCLMTALLRNMESKCAAGNGEALKATAQKIIKRILRLSPKGPLLHPSYSLRRLKFISDTLDKAERVMIDYAYQASNELGPSRAICNALSQSVKKRFMDAICLYDAYCILFLSENAILSEDETSLRQSFLEEDGIPGEVIKRFYSIMHYLENTYYCWINNAVDERLRAMPIKSKSSSLLISSANHIHQLVNYLAGSGPSVYRMLRDMESSRRSEFLLKSLERCKTNAAYHRKVTAAQGKGDKRHRAYHEIGASLSKLQVQTAHHFWDPARMDSLKRASLFWSAAELQLRNRPDT